MKKRTSLRRNSMRCDRICGAMWAETLTPFELNKLQVLIIMAVFVGFEHSHIHIGSGSVGPTMWKFGQSGNSITKSRIACLHANFGMCRWWWLGNRIHRHIIARNIGVFWFRLQFNFLQFFIVTKTIFPYLISADNRTHSNNHKQSNTRKVSIQTTHFFDITILITHFSLSFPPHFGHLHSQYSTATAVTVIYQVRFMFGPKKILLLQVITSKVNWTVFEYC